MLEVFPLRSGISQGCPFLPFLFKIILEVLTEAIRQEKKSHSNQKERRKVSLSADDMICYVKNPKDYTKKLINKISKTTGKINIQKPKHFYTFPMKYLKKK